MQGKKSMKNLIQWVESHSNMLILLIMLVGFLLGSIYSVQIGEKIKFPDENRYYQLALNLKHNHMYSLNGTTTTAYLPPGLPLTLVPFMYLSESFIFLRIINIIFYCISIYLVYRIVTVYTSSFWGILAGFIYLCYPVMLFTANTLYPQTLATMLLLLSIFIMSENKTFSAIKATAAGACFAFLILAVPTFLLILPLFCTLLFFKIKKPIKTILLVLVGTSLCLAPWAIRNYSVYKKFILVSANSGEPLLFGNSENAGVDTGPTTDISQYTAIVTERGISGLEQDNFYKQAAVNYIMTHKIKTIKMYFLKFINYFNYRNNLRTTSEISQIRNLVMLFTYGPLLLIFLFRLVTIYWIKGNYFEWFLMSMYIFSGMTYAIFFTRIRYRLPFDALLIILVTIFLYRLYNNKYDAEI